MSPASAKPESRDESEYAKSRDFPPHPRASWEAWPNAGLAGWGGRDRTSEWRNQNPLPYRLATPQQAGAGGIDPRDFLRHRRSIEGLRPFQQAGSAKSTQNPGAEAPLLHKPFVLEAQNGFPSPRAAGYRPSES